MILTVFDEYAVSLYYLSQNAKKLKIVSIKSNALNISFCGTI